MKLLKAKEQLKDAKESTMGMIAKLKAETHRSEEMKAPENKGISKGDYKDSINIFFLI